MVPLLLWSASTSLLLTIPLITVFFPLACSLTSASTEKHWHGFSHILATDIRLCMWAAQPLVNNHALLVFRRAACSGRCSSHTTSRRSVALSVDSVSIITHTLMICSCMLKWLTGACSTGSHAASVASSTGSCKTTCC